MTKKFYVPEKKVIGASSPIPKAVEKAFPKIEESKNSIDPSAFKNSTLERLPDDIRDKESFATVAAYVVKLGPDAYKDSDKFPSGAYCDEKNWVLMGRYAGNRFKVEGLEVRLINDDNIIATILDPSDVSYV